MRLRTIWILTFVYLLGLLAAGTLAAENRLFEMRTYTAVEGKIDALHARFRDHTTKLFEKHGMTVIAYWVPTDGERSQRTLIYVLAYPDRGAREKAWQAFIADPEWLKVFEESRADGPLVEKVDTEFLYATDYSPLK